MEFERVLGSRRMVRSFSETPVPRDVVDRLLSRASRAPSAGNSQGWHFVVLEGPAETARFWDVTLPAARRGSFPWPQLLKAPVIVIPLADPSRYLERYSEPDKSGSGLGAGIERWPVPYWTVDTAFATMMLLLATVDEGLGALFFGIFENSGQVLEELGVPAGLLPIGAVALGHPAEDRPSRSTARGRRSLEDVVHYGRWGARRPGD